MGRYDCSIPAALVANLNVDLNDVRHVRVRPSYGEIKRVLMVLKKRSRLVSFRMSEEEYQRLCTVCVTVGARSMSDLARNAVARFVAGPGDGGEDPMLCHVRTLDRAVQQLESRVEQLSKRLMATEQFVPFPGGAGGQS